MQKEFCDYTISLVLKELGFNEPCLAYYVNETFKCKIYLNKDANYNSDFTIGNLIAAPLYSQIIDWFREKYGLHIDIGLDDKEEGYYNYAINLNWRYDGGTYYEARKLAILDAIKVVQNKEDKSWRFPYETN
jgi:hypothetical protein